MTNHDKYDRMGSTLLAAILGLQILSAFLALAKIINPSTRFSLLMGLDGYVQHLVDTILIFGGFVAALLILHCLMLITLTVVLPITYPVYWRVVWAVKRRYRSKSD